MLHFIRLQLINFSVSTPFKICSKSSLGWNITTKRKNKREIKTLLDLKYKGLQKQKMTYNAEK